MDHIFINCQLVRKVWVFFLSLSLFNVAWVFPFAFLISFQFGGSVTWKECRRVSGTSCLGLYVEECGKRGITYF